jgi:hypothetical protein
MRHCRSGPSSPGSCCDRSEYGIRETHERLIRRRLGPASGWALLEGPLFRWFRFGFAGLTVASSLPLVALSLLIACLGVAVVALLPPFVARRGTGGLEFQKQWAEEEFRFEDSVRSYENLIDTHVRKRR